MDDPFALSLSKGAAAKGFDKLSPNGSWFENGSWFREPVLVRVCWGADLEQFQRQH
jgi:hypothetical protein